MPVPSQGHYGFHSFRLLTDFVCLYNYEFWLSLCKIVQSSIILLLPLFSFLSWAFCSASLVSWSCFLCTQYCQFFWIFHSWYSLYQTFIEKKKLDQVLFDCFIFIYALFIITDLQRYREDISLISILMYLHILHLY